MHADQMAAKRTPLSRRRYTRQNLQLQRSSGKKERRKKWWGSKRLRLRLRLSKRLGQRERERNRGGG